MKRAVKETNYEQLKTVEIGAFTYISQALTGKKVFFYFYLIRSPFSHFFAFIYCFIQSPESTESPRLLPTVLPDSYNDLSFCTRINWFYITLLYILPKRGIPVLAVRPSDKANATPSRRYPPLAVLP